MLNKKVTIKDVSRQAGVAISTVSNALNPSSKKISTARRNEILKIVKEMNYVPDVRGQALSLRGKKRVGFFMNSDAFKFKSENNINTKIIYYLNYYAFKNDVEIVNLFSFDSNDTCESIIAKINSHTLSDIIVFGVSVNDVLLKEINSL